MTWNVGSAEALSRTCSGQGQASLNQTEAKADVFPLWKRTLDFGVILLALPVALPLGLFIAAFIKIVSPGPVFFRQERVGYRGRRFRIFKFRSMRVNADTASHKGHTAHLMKSDVPMTKLDIKGDPRLIRGGSFLRASGLDELPQLLNVLVGDMSIVGPRPAIPYEFDQYSTWAKRRVDAPPGLTGLWQVSGKNKTTFSQMIQYDVYYAHNASLWLDCKIILKTFGVLADQIRETRRRPASAPTGQVSAPSLKEA